MFLGIGNSVPISKGGHRPPNPGFEYNPIAWCQDDGAQTPTITGDQGGVFSYVNEATGTATGLSSFDTATGAIGANSTPGSYAITYSVNGVSETDVITISPDVSTSFTYPSTVENRFTISPTQAVATAGVYSFTVNPGNITFANGAATSTTGEINLTGATLGSYTVQFLPNSSCGNPTTASFTVVQAFESFEFTIQTSSPNETFTIPTTGSGYSYHVDWGTGNAGQNNFAGPYTGNVTSPVYNSAGTYTVKIGILNDTFPRIYFNNSGDKAKMRNIVKWGEFQWTSFLAAFSGCSNLDVIASDTPNLTNCNNFNEMFFRCFPSLTGTTAGTNWNWTFNNNASNFGEMFRRAGNFNGDISNWDTSKVTDMNLMFAMDAQGTQHQFNQNIGSWDVSDVTNMSSMFNNSIFNQDIGNWDTSKVTNMAYMFVSNGNFNQDINTKDYPAGSRLAWDVSSCTNFASMFAGCISFTSSVNKWKIYTGSSNVSMERMFSGATSFNGSLNTEQFTVGQGGYQQTYLAWDIQKVNNLSNVIKNTQVNTSLSNWDTSNVTTIQELFKDTSFNQPLVNQQVTVGTGATARTYNAWDVSNVTNMYRVFRDNNAFNQDLSSWDINTSGNVNMSQMFYSADSFDQDLSNWTVTNVNNFSQFLNGVALSTTNYDAILTAWDAQGAMAYSGTADFGNSVPSCDNAASNGAFAARASLITKWGGITDKFSQNNTCQPLADFDYSSTAYCANGSDVTPTITGTVDQTLPLGGNISDAWSSTTGLQINNLTGEIDVDQSTTGTYQITRTVSNSPGSLSSSATDTVTINPADNATFSYSGSPYDIASASNPTPTVTGLSGGTFSSIDHFEFNGTDDFIDFPVQADFLDVYIMPQDPRTLSVWINPSDVNSGYTKPLISNRLWQSVYYQGYSLSMRDGGALDFTFFLTKTNVSKYYNVRTTETLSAGNWYNIVLTDNGDLTGSTTSPTDILNNYNIYINNIPATLTNHSNGLPSGFIGSATNWYGTRLNIGAAEGYTSSGNNSYFPGLISNASIFTESLTSAKVNELYNNGIPGNLSNHSSSSNLVGWWKLGSDATYNSSTSSWSFPNAANPGTGNGTSTTLPSTSIRTIDLNSTTGLISLSNSNVGTYGIVYNTTGATGSLCPATDTQSIQLINTNFDYPTNVCNASGSPTILPNNFISGQSGTFTISPTSGAPGIDATSGLLSPAGSTAGTYAITYTIGSNSTTKNITSGAVLNPSTTTNTSTLSFNGTSSYIASSYNGNVTALSLWFKPSSAITTLSSPQYIINFGGTWNGIGLGGFTSALTNELIIVTDANIAGRSAYTSSGFISTDWHHLVINWSGSVYEIWLDGTNVQNATTGTPTLINASSIEIGRRSTSPNYYFNGEIDEVAIWNTNLTSCDVAGIYQASSNGITADLSTVYPNNLKYYNRMGD